MISNKVKLRSWSLSDAPALAEFANNKRIADNLRDAFPYPYSIKDANNFIQAALKKDSSAQLYAIDVEGIAVGSIGAMYKEDVYRLNVEIGYWLAEEYWGKGIISAAIGLLVNNIFNKPDTERIYAEVYEDNIASHKVLEKTGFKKEAVLRRNIIKNDKIKDSFVYALHRKDYFQKKG